MHSDIAEAIDKGCLTGLTIFYLCAYFDVMDHSILLKRLELSFDTNEKALICANSYHADITLYVSVADKISPNVGFYFGVRQESVLAPKKYYMYTKPVGEIIKQHTIKYYCYVDHI